MYVSLCFSLFATTIGLCVAQNISTSSTCGDQCRTLSTTASSWEAEQHVSADLSFYTVPANFSSSLPPGSLLHVEAVTNLSGYTVPSSLSMSRIIYTTADHNGTTLPTSAYILWPYAPLGSAGLKKNQFPLVAWAHGTSGFFKACAPSNYRSLQYHFMAPYLLALQGMAVVAPDYAGLGIDRLPNGQRIGHNWLNGPSQATDLANAVIAARKAFPVNLPAEGPFVAMGHSQGGAAAWAFSERMASRPIAGYKGTVAIAPPTRHFELLAQNLADPAQAEAPVITTQQPALIAAVTAAFPSFNYTGLTPLSYDRWMNVLAPLSGCFPTTVNVFADVSLDQLAEPGWNTHPTVQQYANISQNGRKRFKGPLLVLAGDSDQVVSVRQMTSAVNDTCNMLKQEGWKESLEFVTYQDMNHFPVIQASSMKWLPWVKDRLSGKLVSGTGCVKSVADGFRTDFTVETLGPNFLVEWASPQDSWQFLL
jgi:pimeloyl-ACP methyl ester carboxylesterase